MAAAATAPLGCFAIVVAVAATNGGYFPTSWGWSALVLAAVALIALIGRAEIALSGALVAWVGAWTLLAGWYALSITWSDSAPQSVEEVERVLVYVALTASVAALVRPELVGRLLGATLAAIVAVAAYSLATRLFPDRIGVVDPAARYRLSTPLGYWNGLGIFCAIGALLALGFAVRAASTITRAAAAAAVVPLVTTLYFTFSRGAWIALAVGALAALVLTPRRLALATMLLAAGALAALSVWVASRSDALTRAGAGVGRAAHDGHRVAIVVVALAAGAALAAAACAQVERQLSVPRAVRIVYGCVLVGAAAAVLAATFARYGDPETLARKGWRGFASRPVALGGDLNRRLFSVSGNGRLDLWRAAWHDARAHPWLGSGAGTYEGWWYAHRPDQSTVRDAHGLYVETLAELGPPGLALLALALGIPLAVAIRARRHPFGAFAFAAYIAWLVHAGGDWDWELPGVVVPALLCGGALLVAAAGSRDEARQAGIRLRASGIGLAGAVGALAFIGLGGNVHLASSRAAADGGRWAASEDAARAALSWAPWSGEAWKLIADSQLHRGRRSAARVSLRKAIGKDPRNWKLYVELAYITKGAERRAAVARAAQLNPRQAAVRALGGGR